MRSHPTRQALPCSDSHRSRSVGALLAIAGLVGLRPASALAEAAPVPASTFTVRSFDGRREFRVANPDAERSLAWPTDQAAGPAPAQANGLSTPSVVTSRVVVRFTDDRDDRAFTTAARAITRHAPKLADPSGRSLARFRLIDAGSVREAAAIASALSNTPGVAEAWVDTQQPLALRSGIPTDPGLVQQWHLINATNPGYDIGVTPVWENGITGLGVTVGIIEGGFNASHPDIVANFNTDASQPDVGMSDHGTSCAGLVAAVPNNALGGTGVAYNARVSRQYYGPSSVIAAAFAFRNDLNDIKSNSWGPIDNARVTFTPSIEQQALAEAATSGRGGKGTVFVWAGGNGGASNDRVDYDSYASNRHVIAVGAIDFFDRRSAYSEPGSALFCVAPSSFDFFGPGPKIYTTIGQSEFTPDFGGTSAASPIAAGVVALMLEANPALTARDVSEVIARTARLCDPTDSGWTLNGANVFINYNYGFGAINASRAVALARTWTNVGPERSVASVSADANKAIPDNTPGGVASTLFIPANLRIERVQLVLTAPHPRIGDLHVALTSPAGTESIFAEPRNDSTAGAYNAYTFTTVRSWDELSRGTWTLSVSDLAAGQTGTLSSWSVRVFGTLPPCPSDWDRSGATTSEDFYAFLNDYFSGGADFDLDGASTSTDVFAYLNAYFARGSSCP